MTEFRSFTYSADAPLDEVDVKLGRDAWLHGIARGETVTVPAELAPALDYHPHFIDADQHEAEEAPE